MSLPFLLSRGGGANNANGTKHKRGNGTGGGKQSGAGVCAGSRTSLDAGHTHVGTKRTASMIVEASSEPTSRLYWEELLGTECSISETTQQPLPRVAVCSLSELGSEMADCLASKAGVAQLGIFDGSDTGQLTKYRILPGVTVHKSAADAFAWADIIMLCGSYEEGACILQTAGARRHLKGKCVLQLGNGTPQEAMTAAALVEKAKGQYLDACLLSEARGGAFGAKGMSMIVCGDKAAWSRCEEVVRSVAPAAFYGGRHAEQANAVGVAICTFMTSVYMGLQQAAAITDRFAVPVYLLPRLLATSYMPLVKGLVLGGTSPLGSAPSHSRTPSATPTLSRSTAVTTSAAADGAPAAGSPAWRSQLERIQRVCAEAGIEHGVIDGFLASGAAGGAAAAPASVARSVQGAARAMSGCLDSWVSSPLDAPPAPAECDGDSDGDAVAKGLTLVSSALDLLELDALDTGLPGFASDDLGLAWAP